MLCLDRLGGGSGDESDVLSINADVDDSDIEGPKEDKPQEVEEESAAVPPTTPPVEERKGEERRREEKSRTEQNRGERRGEESMVGVWRVKRRRGGAAWMVAARLLLSPGLRAQAQMATLSGRRAGGTLQETSSR